MATAQRGMHRSGAEQHCMLVVQELSDRVLSVWWVCCLNQKLQDCLRHRLLVQFSCIKVGSPAWAAAQNCCTSQTCAVAVADAAVASFVTEHPL